MAEAASQALNDAHVKQADVDGLLCGYSTTFPHLMLSTRFAEQFGISPSYAHGVQLGGATGFAMVALAHLLVDARVVERVLVVAGENRLTGQASDTSTQTLAQVGHSDYEVPLGLTVPAYYALVASRYMHDFKITERDLAALAVLMRKNAVSHPGAHLRVPITETDVLSSRPVALPLKTLDCCPVSDGAAAALIVREPPSGRRVRIRATGQAHLHQHVTAADFANFGARVSSTRALQSAGISLDQIGYLAIYDSFTITLAILLEEIGVCARGEAGRLARDGAFDSQSDLPLNTHGGLLSYGHCGVAGAMSHLAEIYRQMTRTAGPRQIRSDPDFALAHGDGGVLSSHVSLILERQ
jgi:acetyl-CoA acetyltransferase